MSFSVIGKGFCKLNFRIDRRKPRGHNPLVQNPLQWGSEPGVMFGGLRMPILKFSFQVGDV